MWNAGVVAANLDSITPLVAQWEKSTHPAQIRLDGYLRDITSKLSPLLPLPSPSFLHLHVRASSRASLLLSNDLENFVTPLFGKRWLNPLQFSLVIGTKDITSDSRIRIGIAEPATDCYLAGEWSCCTISAPGDYSKLEWKEQLRKQLSSTDPLPADGPVDVRVLLTLPSNRKWNLLWKPVVDAMGPVLGYTMPGKLYHPRDDRITRLEFHRIIDDSLKRTVLVCYQWRMSRV